MERKRRMVGEIAGKFTRIFQQNQQIPVEFAIEFDGNVSLIWWIGDVTYISGFG